MKQESKNILITGASTGIGYGAAKELVSRGYTVFGSVRKDEDGSRVKNELGNNFIPLVFDVVDQKGIERATEELRNHIQGQGLGGLINNAGISVSGPIELLTVEEMAKNFDVNVWGVLRVTKAMLPLLGAEKDHPSLPGRILNISSVAGKIAAPYLGPYSGTKHALEAFSHTMRREFMRYGIEVIIIGPGPIQTPIWDKGSLEKFTGTSYYESLGKFFRWFVTDGKQGMPLDKCSARIADIFEANKPKTRYSIVQGKFMKWTLPTTLPDRMVDDFFRKMM